MSNTEMLWAIYCGMIIVWIAFQSAVNLSFPKNKFMPRNMGKNSYGELIPWWGITAAVLWPATLMYLLFLLLILPIKGVQLGIEVNKRRVAERDRLKTVPNLPEYPGRNR